MTPQELKDKLKLFAYRTVRGCESMPTGSYTSQTISRQLLRSSLSSAANYRAATRAQSKKQFLSKLNISLEELDESCFWLEAVKDLEIIHADKLSLLLEEAMELTKILSATKNTTVRSLKAKNHKS